MALQVFFYSDESNGHDAAICEADAAGSVQYGHHSAVIPCASLSVEGNSPQQVDEKDTPTSKDLLVD